MEKQLWLRLLAGALFAAGCVAFWATLSRAALASLVVAMGIGVLVLFVRKGFGLKAMLLMVCTGLLVAGPAAKEFIDNMAKRPSNFEGRLVIMQKAAIMIIENPLFGVGLNNNTAVKRQRFRPNPLYPGEERFPVHNHYLVVWSEAGLIGLVLQLAMFYLALNHAWVLSRSGDRLVRMFAIAAFISFLAVYMNLTGDHFSGNAQRSLFFFFAGTVMAMHAFNRREAGVAGDSLRAGGRDGY
jgi:O-antigen ligase